ncbi:hypothetical protein PAECIP111890_03484 [Paenibacillus sp. JJ-223]|nr:hypothetical protein PAECIP111890_03484 [Paenibacillus sp. JJ-223]
MSECQRPLPDIRRERSLASSFYMHKGVNPQQKLPNGWGMPILLPFLKQFIKYYNVVPSKFN